MSSEFQPLDYRSTEPQAAETTETLDSSPLRFNSLTLDELREELERRTKETQRLQEEVENATRFALKTWRGCTHDISSTPWHSLNVDGSSWDSATVLAHHQGATHPQAFGQEVSAPGKVEEALDECLQQLHIEKHEQEDFSCDKAVVNLQAKLQKVQMEKNILSDLRLKDSRKHVDQMQKMLHMLEELQNLKRCGDQKLQESENKALALNRRVETLERNVKEMHPSLLSHKKQSGLDSSSRTKDVTARPLLLVAMATDYLKDETDEQQEGVVLPASYIDNEECSEVNKRKERMEDLIGSIVQEMAMLTHNLCSSKDSGVSLSVKLELLKKLIERQASVHQHQVIELGSTLSCHKDKVCLEQQLLQAQSLLVDIQREKEQSLQQVEELQSQLGQVERCAKQQQRELQEEVKILRGHLNVAREQLNRAGQEKTCLQALLEQRAQERRTSQEEELEHRAKQALSRFEEAQSRCNVLDAERETLRLELDEKEKMVEFLRFQWENSCQIVAQHRHTIDSLLQENNFLSNQLNQHKLETQKLRTEVDQHKSDMAAAELEKHQLHASLTETLRVQEEILEKQKLSTLLEVQHVQLLTLAKEHKELKQLHSCKNEEHKGVVLKLQSQLKSTQAELVQVKSTLRTLEGADGHGLQVAVGMQKEITARRDQTDCLQAKIQHLEETVEKLCQEKCYQNLENQHQLKELVLVREEKRQLTSELEALSSKDKQLRDRIGELEAILHKMSVNFADCQDFIQLQEQEFFRLKLKHALDLKELQGQNGNVAPPVSDSSGPCALSDPPSCQLASNTQIKCKRRQESPTQVLQSLVKELRQENSENHRPHTNNSGIHRRRSAPERVHRSTLTEPAQTLKPGSRFRRKTCGSEPHLLKTSEQNEGIISNSNGQSYPISTPVTAARYVVSAQLLSLGRKSPVHSLLTSDPNSQ
ncbi:coiled-coil domain-containing protein 158-like [Aulostomus maculatus]